MLDGARDLRILVVDGDGPNRALLVEVLRGEGWLVDGVASADAARDRLRAVRYELVVAEVTLEAPDDAPEWADGLGGLTLAREITNDLPCMGSRPAVILVSASLRPSLPSRAEEAGASAFLIKPFRMFELLDQARKALSRRRASDSPPSLPSSRLRRLRQDAATTLPSGVALRAVLRRALRSRLSPWLSLVVVRVDDELAVSDRLGFTALLGDLAATLARPGTSGEGLGSGAGPSPIPLAAVARSGVYRIEDNELAFFGYGDLRHDLGAIGTTLFRTLQESRAELLPIWLSCAVTPLPAPAVDSDRVLRFARALLDRARAEGIGAVTDEVPAIEGEKATSRFQLGSSRKPDLARRHRSSAPPRKLKS